uniref:CUB domain-containing protein n=1 Tax=Meloidogyne incognita TaxID=6306 RepID=A0A914L6A4_MELIC
MYCLWHFEAPGRYIIAVNISKFNTEENQDFVTIFDGDDTNQKYLEMLSGRITSNKTIKSKRNLMTISFHSDITLEMSGFALWYKAGRS